MRWAPLVALLWVGCSKHASTAVEDSGPQAAVDSRAEGEPAESPPRCAETSRASLADPDAGDPLDFGPPVYAGGAWLVGLTRAGATRKCGVARLGAHEPSRVVELARAGRDDPPPKVFTRGTEVLAAAYVTEGGASSARVSRRLKIYRVTDSPEVLVTVPQQAGDDSPAFDISPSASGERALVVWDEDDHAVDAGPVRRGVIRAALLAPDLRSVAHVLTISPDISDAERPRVVARDGGYWAAWIARRAEPPRELVAPPGGDAAVAQQPELEAPGEERELRWVELLALDEEGRPAGAIRRLSPVTGHTAGYELTSKGSRVDAFVVLDDEAAEHSGGSLLHAVAMPDGAPRNVPVRPVGVAHGTSPWVAWTVGVPGWLAYADTSDRMRLVPLDADGEPAGPDSVEPAFDDARPSAASTGQGAEVLALTPGPKARATWLSCAPPKR